MPPTVLQLTRFAYFPGFTLGNLRVAGVNIATLELPWRDNAQSVSCIPTGEYAMKLWESPKHGESLILVGVPGRSFIELHIANKVKELMGCIAVGMSYTWMRDEPFMVESRRAMSLLLDAFRADKAARLRIDNIQAGEL